MPPMLGKGGGGGGMPAMLGNGAGGRGMPGSGGAGGAFIMEDVGVTAAVPEGGGGGGVGGGAWAGAAFSGGLDVSGKTEQPVNWEDEVIFSLAGGPEEGAGVLVGFDDPAGVRDVRRHGSSSAWMLPFALPDSWFSALFCLFGCFLIDSSLSMTSSTVFAWTRETSECQRRGWGPKVDSCYLTPTKEQIWSHSAHSLVSLYTTALLASRQYPSHGLGPSMLF